MEITWWGMSGVCCPKCDTGMVPGEVHFSADGQIRFLYSCPACKMFSHMDYFASQLQAIAFGLDLEKRLGNSQPTEPQLLLPRVPERLTSQDIRDLRRWKIDPENGELQ